MEGRSVTRAQALAAGPLSLSEASDLAKLLSDPLRFGGPGNVNVHPRVPGLALRAALCGREPPPSGGFARGMREVAQKMARA